MYEVIPYPDKDRALINDLIADIKSSGNPKNWIDLRKYMDKLAEHGLEMNEKFKRESFKKLEDDLYELRTTNLRVMFTFFNGKFYILNGFFKKSQSTPPSEIEIARKHIKNIHKKQW